MTRINTNVSSLVAQKTLARSNDQLQTALTRLSTGLKINVGKDDPAGLIASEVLRSDIISVNRAISNSERANQIIATADSALGQVSALLNDIRGLVSEAANTGALSDEQIAANQLQVDSSLEAIDRIAQTTSFQGRRLLDGSLDFLTSNAGTADTKASGTLSGTTDDVNAAGSFGSTDTFSSLTLTGTSAAPGAVKLTALSAGTRYNDFSVTFAFTAGVNTGATVQSSINSAGGGSVRFVLFSDSTATSAVTAFNGNLSAAAIFSASTVGTATNNLVSAAADTTASATTGGAFDNKITIESLVGGSTYNNLNIIFTDSAATGAETASYATTGNTLTIFQKAGASTTAQVLSAINSTGVFSASTSGGGLGVYTASGSSFATVTTGGSNGNKLVLSASVGGTAYNNTRLTLSDSAATGSETASYNTTTNTLTVFKAANSTVSQIAAAINTNGVFSASTTTAGLGTIAAGTTGDVTTGGATGAASISDLKIEQANFGTAASIGVAVQIDSQATQGKLYYNGGTLTSDLILELGGKNGFETFNFGSGTTSSQIATAINTVADSTGIQATVVGTSLELKSTEYGSNSFVSAKALSGNFGTVDGAGATASRSSGADVSARINGVQATGQGLRASLNTSTLDLNFVVNSSFEDGDSFEFNINGGGATFQIGPDVVSNQQARLGIQGVNTATLGGVSGKLFEVRSGGAKALASDVKGAAKIIDEVIATVTGLRGRLGAFQRTTLESNIVTLNATLENLTAAESSIRDADFAAESAKLTRAQILVQSGTSVLQISNTQPQNVLALLRG
jgi:flagellin